ncbi:MAG: ArsR/SmtB family transcription factor [Actinomycetota bacterium]
MSSGLLDALGDPTRRAVLESLRTGPKPVSALASGLPVSRPAVSQHLKVLADAGLVRHEKVGRQRLYEIEPAGLEELRDYVESFWTDVLTGFKDRVEKGASP